MAYGLYTSLSLTGAGAPKRVVCGVSISLHISFTTASLYVCIIYGPTSVLHCLRP